ncbi:MAG: hypothetical protein ACE5IT_08285 [bacterium]
MRKERLFLPPDSYTALPYRLIAYSWWWKRKNDRQMRQLSWEEKGLAMYTNGIKVNLTEEEVKEAIDWGAENKDSPENIRSLYGFGELKGHKEYGYVATKFYTLAFLGCRSARRYKSPGRDEIEEILSSKEFWIRICTYGDKIDFAENYRIVLKRGKKVIKPGTRGSPRWTKTTAVFPSSPSYQATVTAFFPYSAIDPKAKTKIILIKDKGESSFEVNFSQYK